MAYNYTSVVEAVHKEGEEGIAMHHKVAILMVALGQEASGQVMKYLSDVEIEAITQSIADLKNVDSKVMDAVLSEFEQLLLAGDYISQGGMDFARDILERAVGPRKAQEILDRVNTKTTSGFYILKNVAPQQIVPFISQEHPQTIALILSQLEADQAAGILGQLPEYMQADVAFRIASMDNITPNVLKQIEESLESSLQHIIGGNQDVGGPKVVADILNLTGASVERSVLDQMDASDPEVAENVRNLMFVFARPGQPDRQGDTDSAPHRPVVLPARGTGTDRHHEGRLQRGIRLSAGARLRSTRLGRLPPGGRPSPYLLAFRTAATPIPMFLSFMSDGA
jgi:flagellar motor switch protein FliG